MSDNKDERKKMAFTYAWNWFCYHAKQRYSAFYYFLIVIGALALAYVQSNNNTDLQKAIAVIGLIISIAFLFIERRNRELVNDGRAALDLLEKNGPPFNKYQIRKIDSLEGRKNFFRTHTFWFRIIIITAAIFSIIALLELFSEAGIVCKSIIITLSILLFITWAFFLNDRKYDLPIKGNK